MNFQELIKHRYSCRQYSNQPVESEQLELVLEAARLAPTAANRQPFNIYVIPTDQYRDQLSKIYSRDWFVQPPLVLCAAAIPDQGWVRHRFDDENYAVVDTAIVVDHITLQAADLGLGTCWVGAFDPQAACDLLPLSENEVPVAFTPLGYPLDEAQEKTRKEIGEIITYLK